MSEASYRWELVFNGKVMALSLVNMPLTLSVCLQECRKSFVSSTWCLKSPKLCMHIIQQSCCSYNFSWGHNIWEEGSEDYLCRLCLAGQKSQVCQLQYFRRCLCFPSIESRISQFSNKWTCHEDAAMLVTLRIQPATRSWRKRKTVVPQNLWVILLGSHFEHLLSVFGTLQRELCEFRSISPLQSHVCLFLFIKERSLNGDYTPLCRWRVCSVNVFWLLPQAWSPHRHWTPDFLLPAINWIWILHTICIMAIG